jgi:hypothetical protein
MNKYIENPKTIDSGIMCTIPQTGKCPNNCEDCFFQSGRSYLEPLDNNLPNMYKYKSIDDMYSKIIRINDGNDSNVNREKVIEMSERYINKFYNTSIPTDLEGFVDPVVLTINQGKMTDKKWHKLDPIPKNLMFVRIRTNMWNMENVVRPAIVYYTEKRVPIVLTFMAYYDTPVPEEYQDFYLFTERTLNSYWVLKSEEWKKIMDEFWKNDMVYSCSKIEGENASRKCARCGNCVREFFVTKERINQNE